MKLWTALALSALLVGCSCSHHDDDASISNDLRNSNNHYVSAQVNGQPARINLEQVRQAFWATQGNDMNTAMRAFEQRVNEIYEGDEIVQVDAARQSQGLLVVGFIDRNGQPGFQPGDDRLFTIEQTSAANNGQIGYSMTGWNNQPYYNGYYTYHDHGSGLGFMTGLMLGHMLWGHWGTGYHYYTPVEHIHVIHDYRTTYRTSPTYHLQQQQNHVFTTRFNKQNATGGLASNRKFGGASSTTSGSTTGRRWGGGNSSGTTTTTTTTTNSGSGWGGRRSSSSSTSTTTRSWGSGSSSSSSSGSSWGGRRSSSGSSFGGRRRH